VGFCVQCDVKTHANCTGVAPIPIDGFWQSHPRSPLVHRCLVDAACNKQKGRRVGAAGAMYNWAVLNRDKSIGELGVVDAATGLPLYREYTDMQCANGYQVRMSLGVGRERFGGWSGAESGQDCTRWLRLVQIAIANLTISLFNLAASLSLSPKPNPNRAPSAASAPPITAAAATAASAAPATR